MTSTLHVLRVNDKTNVVYIDSVRMTNTGTNTCIETAGCVI